MASPTLELAAAEAWIGPLLLTLPRLLALFAVLPFFSGSMLNGMTRAGLMTMLALYFSPAAGALPDWSVGQWALVAAKEALIGTLLGLGFGIIVWAVQSAGDIIDFQTGSSNATVFDPTAGHEGGPTGTFLGWLVFTLFVSAGGLVAMLGVLVDSYRIWPVASFWPNAGPALEQFAIRQGEALFMWILKIAAPVVFVLMLVEIGLGLIGRSAPQLNIFVFSQPLKSLLAHLMMLLFLLFLYDSMQAFLRPENGVLNFLRHAL